MHVNSDLSLATAAAQKVGSRLPVKLAPQQNVRGPLSPLSCLETLARMSSGAEVEHLKLRPWKCPQRIPLSPSVCISSSPRRRPYPVQPKKYSFSPKNYLFQSKASF